MNAAAPQSRVPATRVVAQRKLAARSKAGRFDPILWIIIAAFVVWELVAHFVLHNDEGHTLSNRIDVFEKWAGAPGYAAVIGVLCAAAVVLPLHLVAHTF